MDKIVIKLAGLLGFGAVAIGAFAHHALKATWGVRQLAWLETGARYQLIHAAVLIGLGALGKRYRFSALLIAVGIVIFSGGLYLLALTEWRWLVAIPPIGGFALLAGWLSLLWEGRRRS